MMHDELERAFSLTGRVAVVTGAASGIGRQAAVTFAQAGAAVVLADVQPGGLATTAQLVADAGGRAVPQVVDVARRADVDGLAATAVRELGRVDIWANVAGVIRYAPIVDMREDDLRAIVDVNLLGVYWGIAAAARAMRDTGGGAIVNIASAGGDVPAPTLSVYGMTKAGVMHLTKTAAAELGPLGIRVNAVAPGFVETAMVAPYYTDDQGNVDEAAKARTLAARAGGSPLQATGVPTDISYAMLYLVSDAARFMTGQVLRPNGGVFMA